jgi:MFS transporter, DHA3 family, tetracycline resistance protein
MLFAWNTHKWDARRVYLLLSVLTSFSYALAFAAAQIYRIQTVGLDALQLVLIGTILEVAVFVFEVPTGVVADVYSRRLSVVIGFALVGIGFLVEAAYPSFWVVAAAQVIWGIGYTFTSGATEAWITDEVGAEQVGPVFLQAARWGTLAGIAATIIAILIGSIQLTLPFIIGGVGFLVLVVLLILWMPETGFHPQTGGREGGWSHMRHTLSEGFNLMRGSRILLLIMVLGVIFGLYSEGYDRLNEAHLLQSFAVPDLFGLQPIAWINILGLIGGLLTALALRWSEQHVQTANGAVLVRAISLLTGLLVANLLLFALIGNFFIAVLVRWGVGILRSVIEPLYTTWVNQHAESSVRATVISMGELSHAAGELGGGPPVGLIGQGFGLRAALASTAFILLPSLLLLRDAWRRETLR